MNFKKNVAAILTGITLASLPAMAVSANGIPKNSSNYWNKVRYIKVNKNISAVQRKVKNNSIQPKINKKMTVKKGTILAINRIKNNHEEWLLLDGLKNSKNSVWSTNQKNTNWMSKYAPKPVQPKLIKLNKKINIIEKATKNNIIQKKTLKEDSLKKNTIVYVKNMGGNEWLVYGNNMPKTSKNGAWITNQNGNNWMTKYTPKPINKDAKYVQIDANTPIVEKEVKNNTIQNKTINKSNLKPGTTVLVKQLGEKEWLVYGNNIPKGSNNGAWTTQQKNWNDAPTIKSQYSTVSSSSIGKDYSVAYLPNDITSNNQVIMKTGQKIQAKKIDNNTESIKLGDQEFKMSVPSNGFATKTNASILKNNVVVSTYAPDNANAVISSNYSPKNNDQWQQSIGNGNFKIFVYSKNNNGWIYTGIVSNN